MENYFVFAADQLVIGYDRSSRGSKEITQENWIDMLLNPLVKFARSDHHIAPCGYRALMVWQLAETYYDRPGLCSTMEAACIAYTNYPKSIDMASALFKGTIDYGGRWASHFPVGN